MLETLPSSEVTTQAAPPSASPRFLLTSPEHFTIEYVINPFMDAHVPVDTRAAAAEWERFRALLTDAGAEVEVQPAAEGCPDLVFTNNAALVVDGRALLSRFRHPERRAESPHNRITLENLGIPVSQLPDSVTAFEGSACAMPFRNSIICAYGTRTTQDSVPFVSAFAGVPAVPVELPDPRFYHLDIALCILDEATALVVPDAMTPASVKRLRTLVPNLIELTLDEGLQFCANAVVVGRTVFMHSVPARVRGELAQHGFEAVESPVHEFLKSGGSLCCLALRLDRTTGPLPF